MQIYYHATSNHAYQKILDSGILKRSADSVLYVCKEAKDAIKFALVKNKIEDIRVLELVLDDNVEVIETFDHSYKFFRCRAFGILEDMPVTSIQNIYQLGEPSAGVAE